MLRILARVRVAPYSLLQYGLRFRDAPNASTRDVDSQAAVSTGHETGAVSSMLTFEWDPEKARTNLRKHGVSFAEAMGAFADPFSVTIPDPDHSRGEHRYVLLGFSWQGRLLVVSHTERGETIRIISARHARPREARIYEKDKD